MDDWLYEATADALYLMEDHVSVVGVRNTDESTFRSFFVRSLLERHTDWDCDTEWNRIDLLVRIDSDGDKALIEFKYYLSRPRRTLDGVTKGFKGGAGIMNEKEFWRCVNKLHTIPHRPVASKYLILVYERESPEGVKASYDTSYGALESKVPIVKIQRLEFQHFRCALLAID